MIQENLNKILDQIEKEALNAGRDPHSIKLIAVSKTFPSSVITEALKCGQTLFAENKVQEGVKKRQELANTSFHLHLIGSLQSNKVSKAVKYFDMIHSVGSLELMIKIHEHAVEQKKVMPILFQINTSGEEQKAGFSLNLDLIQEAVERAQNLSGIRLEGLMTMGPSNADPQATQQCFEKLFQLKESLNQSGYALKELSMGMSQDFLIAIRAGSTMLRIGSFIFGNREVPH